MNAYRELIKKKRQEIGDCPMVFAFGPKQFAEAMQKLGLKPTDTDKVCTIFGAGDIVRKEDVSTITEMLKRQNAELKEAIANDKTGKGFILDMFNAALSDHEYAYTHRLDEALQSLGLTGEDIANSPRLLTGLTIAKKEQQDAFDKG